MSKPIYIFAGGGTGGHLFPALAVAEELRALTPEARIVFACSARDIDRRILEPTGYALVPQPIRPMPRSLRGWGAFGRSWLAAQRCGRDLVRDLNPAAVFGLGGFAAEPVVKAAARAGIRTCLLSIDAVPGVANRHLARHVQAVFAQYDATPAAYRGQAGKVQVVGSPVRRALLAGSAEQARRHFGLREGLKTLLVVPGSLGAASINQALHLLAADFFETFADKWQIIHVTGPGKSDVVRVAGVPPARAAGVSPAEGDGKTADGTSAGRAGETPATRTAVSPASPLTSADSPSGPAPLPKGEGFRMHVVQLEFCDRMDLAYAAADLVLCRAGASTIGELLAIGRPAVLMPYPYHRDQHQKHNATAAVAAGACVLIEDTKAAAANAAALRTGLLPLMQDEGRLAAMREAASRLGRRGAAAAIAQWLVG